MALEDNKNGLILCAVFAVEAIAGGVGCGGGAETAHLCLLMSAL